MQSAGSTPGFEQPLCLGLDHIGRGGCIGIESRCFLPYVAAALKALRLELSPVARRLTTKARRWPAGRAFIHPGQALSAAAVASPAPSSGQQTRKARAPEGVFRARDGALTGPQPLRALPWRRLAVRRETSTCTASQCRGHIPMPMRLLTLPKTGRVYRPRAQGLRSAQIFYELQDGLLKQLQANF